MLVEKSPRDETKGDVWQVPWTNQKGRKKKRLMSIQSYFFYFKITFKIQNLQRIIK